MSQTIRICLRPCLRCLIVAGLVAGGIGRAVGQTGIAQALSTLIQSDLADLDARASLADWLRLHPDEKLEPARYDLEYESQGRWCARTMARIQLPQGGELIRYAMFYPPKAGSGLLPPLPAKQDDSLAEQGCTQLSFWYEVHNTTGVADLAGKVSQELTVSWGVPGTVPRSKRSLWNSANWSPLFTWQRGDNSIWVAGDPEGRPKEGSRLLILTRSLGAPRGGIDPSSNTFGIVPGSLPSLAGEAARLAAVDPALTNEILRQLKQHGPSPTSTLPSAPPLEPLERWLRAAQNLPPQRKAAALLVSDFYATAVRGFFRPGEAYGMRLTELGAEFGPAMPPGEMEYKHNWRRQAGQLAAAGPADLLVRMAHLEDTCSFEAESPAIDWRNALIPYGEKFLRGFPMNEWTPYAHFILARAYAAKLMLAYPGAYEPREIYTPSSEAPQLRQAAITHFRDFLRGKADAPEAAWAWEEVWRLLAGLPPAEIHFICYYE
jgi:hypothetical protein